MGSFSGTDQALVAALQRGDQDAVAAFFDRYALHVHRVLVRTLGPDPELSDLVHDVFVAAIEDIDSLKEPDKLKSWLASIAVFTARGCIRKRQRWRWLARESAEEERERRAPPAEISEALRSTYVVLDKLPVDERIAFALRYVHGMKLEEVADACQTSLATIKRRLARAEQKFVELANGHPVLHEWLTKGTRWSESNRR